MFGRLTCRTKAGEYKGEELQLYSYFPTSKAAVPQQQVQPCTQTSLKRSTSNKVRILEEGQIVFCSASLRVAYLDTYFLLNSFDSSLLPCHSSDLPSSLCTEGRYPCSPNTTPSPSCTGTAATTVTSHQQAEMAR